MLYISYGSNLNKEQMAFRCPNSKVLCNGELRGWKLVFNIHADVIKTDNPDDVTPVALWDIADEDWRVLDLYEGFPNYYVKETVDVYCEDKVEKAIVYVMADNRKGICPPMADYYECIRTGYIENGIDTKYLSVALAHSYSNMTKYNQYSDRG